MGMAPPYRGEPGDIRQTRALPPLPCRILDLRRNQRIPPRQTARILSHNFFSIASQLSASRRHSGVSGCAELYLGMKVITPRTPQTAVRMSARRFPIPRMTRSALAGSHRFTKHESATADFAQSQGRLPVETVRLGRLERETQSSAQNLPFTRTWMRPIDTALPRSESLPDGSCCLFLRPDARS